MRVWGSMHVGTACVLGGENFLHSMFEAACVFGAACVSGQHACWGVIAAFGGREVPAQRVLDMRWFNMNMIQQPDASCTGLNLRTSRTLAHQAYYSV